MELTERLKKEVKKILRQHGVNYKPEDLKSYHKTVKLLFDNIDTCELSSSYVLSENFIRTFKCYVDWPSVSFCQKLSEKFIRESKNNIDWDYVCCHQKLSEKFIREFKDKVNWGYISVNQKLSESFIREFKNRIIWYDIPTSQKLSESFIREFQGQLNWWDISTNQKLSDSFIREFKDNIASAKQKYSFKEKSDEQKLKEVKKYAEKYKLKFDGIYLYAYREHDQWGRGAWNKTIFYDKIGKEYRDWRCDMNSSDTASFGLGIWPKHSNVNVKVKVHYKDWGCAVRNNNGKARVLAFTLLGPI